MLVLALDPTLRWALKVGRRLLVIGGIAAYFIGPAIGQGRGDAYLFFGLAFAITLVLARR